MLATSRSCSLEVVHARELKLANEKVRSVSLPACCICMNAQSTEKQLTGQALQIPGQSCANSCLPDNCVSTLLCGRNRSQSV